MQSNDYRASLQHWLTETELRNVSALYNPMTLDELKQIFSMVCEQCIYSCCYIAAFLGLGELFQQLF